MDLLLENFIPDWEQLRKQKEMLIELVSGPIDYEELSGIINLLDYIQDEAVKSGIWTEEEVFGNLNNQDHDNN